MKNNSTPIISLIIPVYNAENYLSYLFDSIKKQTFKDFEAIFVNDSSTDNSLLLLNEFKEEMKDSTISVVIINHKVSSGGPGLPRNTALDVAKGKYICFVDSDDSFKPHFLETLLYAIQKNDSDLGVVNFNYQNTKKFSNNVTKKKMKCLPYYFNEHIDSYGDLGFFVGLKINVLKNIAPAVIWNKIFKKDLIGDNRFLSFGAEDVNFINIYLKKNHKVGFINQSLYDYYIDQKRNSISKPSLNTQYINFCNEVFKITFKILNDYDVDSENYETTAAYFFACYVPILYNLKKYKWNKNNKEVYMKFRNFLEDLFKFYKKNKYISHKWWYIGLLYRVLR